MVEILKWRKTAIIIDGLEWQILAKKGVADHISCELRFNN